MEITALERINAIQSRISEIENKIGFIRNNPGNGKNFAVTLEQEMKKRAQAAETAVSAPVVTNQPVAQASSTNQMPSVGAAGTNAPAFDGSIDALVKQAAQKYGVDPKLVAAVVEAESGGDQSVVSSAGAIGVMQLMPETAASLGVDPYDTKQNIEGGTMYLGRMIKNFGGDLRKAVAAYNAGPQAVRDYNGVPPYAETQAYVNRVLDMYK